MVEDYTIEKATKFIVELNIYKLSSSKEYSSDYDAILRWVVNKVERDEKKEQQMLKGTSNIKFKSNNQREYNDLESFYDNL